jgi:hypothetical protein
MSNESLKVLARDLDQGLCIEGKYRDRCVFLQRISLYPMHYLPGTRFGAPVEPQGCYVATCLRDWYKGTGGRVSHVITRICA